MRRMPSSAAHGRPLERGAATLIAVLFLLIVIAFAVLVASSMSASDITDTNVQQSGVNALFLAESGLERASGRFVTGTSCAGLAVDGPYTLGAGSFTINATYTTDFSGASLPSNECRVQSVGSVGNVQRTVQGILQLPASSGMAVGNRGVAYQCSASGCTATPSTGAINRNLMDVSCASAASCMAVGTGGTAIQWNGAGWTRTNSGTGATLNAVVCQPGTSNNCYAGGSNGGAGVFLHWNGNTWTNVGPFVPPLLIKDLACLFPGGGVTCYAIGTAGANSVIYEYSDINGWSGQLYSTTITLNGISCLSTSSCWVVGNKVSNTKVNIIEYANNTWGPLNPNFGGKYTDNLDDVACADAADCWAVGFRKVDYAYWDGSAWTQVSTANNNLLGIDCPSSGACWTVGANGTAILGSGGSGGAWTWVTLTLTPATTQTLNAVSFPAGSGSSGGSNVLVQWHEVVS